MAKITRFERTAAIGLIVGLLIYIVLRAVLVPITYDEAATFFHYIHKGTFLPGAGHWDANNHLLNSFLTWLSFTAFGSSEFVLRIPNVLAGGLYLLFGYKLSTLVKHKTLQWALFLAIICSRFVLEFFSLSRGYGLSMGLLLPALYYSYLWMQSKKSWQLLLAVIAVQLATWANVSLLMINLLLTAGMAVWVIADKWFKPVALILSATVSSISLYGLISFSFELKNRGLLYYGEGDGFWNVTVGSLVDYGLAPWGGYLWWIVPALLGLTLFGVLAILSKSWKDRTILRPELLFVYLLIGTAVASILLHHLFSVNYPKDRVSVYYLLFLPCSVVFLLDWCITHAIKAAKPLSILATAMLFVLPINLIANLNTSYSILWYWDASAKSYYNLIKEQSSAQYEPTVIGYRGRIIPYNYYNFRNNGALSPIQSEGYRGESADFQIASIEPGIDWSKYDTLAYDHRSTLYLMQRKNQRERKEVVSKKFDARANFNDEFLEWYGGEISDDLGTDLLWSVEVEMPEINKPFEAWIGVTVYNEQGEDVMMENITVDWLKTKWKKGETMKYQIPVFDIPEEATYMKLYFWNIHKQSIDLGEAEVRLFEIVED